MSTLLAALVLPAAIATTELRGIYCITVLLERVKALDQVGGHPTERAAALESVQRIRVHVNPRIRALEGDAIMGAMRQGFNDLREPTAEATERQKTCDTLDWLPQTR